MRICLAHGRHRYRPSVERFAPDERAAFARFCGALLQSVLAKPAASPSLPDVRLDGGPARTDILQ